MLLKTASEAAGTDQRYLLCPSAVTIGHLKKYVKLKFALDHQLAVRQTVFTCCLCLRMENCNGWLEDPLYSDPLYSELACSEESLLSPSLDNV